MRSVKISLCLTLLALFTCSCAQRSTKLCPPPPPPNLTAQPEPSSAENSATDTSSTSASTALKTDHAASNTAYTVSRIFYATDRKVLGFCLPSLYYANVRAEDGPLSYGVAQVSIPANHKPGRLESPSMWRHESPSRDVVMLSVNPFGTPDEDKTFFDELAGQVARTKGHQVFVFIHGFNNTFEDAIRWTAQMTRDINFDGNGVAVVYSWASAARLVDYPADEATVEWTELHLRAFLEELLSQTHASAIHLIAHSMGNRVLVRVLSAMARDSSQGSPPKFSQIVMAAPDIDAGVFRQIAETFVPVATHVTMYVSSRDKALSASRRFHTYPRVGDSGPAVTIVPHIDTIDVSALNTSFSGHDYLIDNDWILSDIARLISDWTSPDKRTGLVPLLQNNQTYWALRPTNAK